MLQFKEMPDDSQQRGLNDSALISSIYSEITKWRRNLFRLPKGNLGKRFVDEMTKLLNTWSTTNEEDALMLLMSMPNLLLQRTSKKVKARVNKNHLIRRLNMWENSEYSELLEEGKCIQQRLKNGSQNQQQNEDWIKSFRNQMMRGKVNPALRLLDKNSAKGVLPICPETIAQLHEKHLRGEPRYLVVLCSRCTL